MNRADQGVGRRSTAGERGDRGGLLRPAHVGQAVQRGDLRFAGVERGHRQRYGAGLLQPTERVEGSNAYAGVGVTGQLQ